MHEGNRTEISTLGEFGLIKHLTQDIQLKMRKPATESAMTLPYWNTPANRYWSLPTC